MTHRQTK